MLLAWFEHFWSVASFLVRLLLPTESCQNKHGPKRKTLQKCDLFYNIQSVPHLFFIVANQRFCSLTSDALSTPNPHTKKHYFRRAHVPITAVQATSIKSLPLSLFSSHHHLVHTPHGWGRHLRWSHRHHLPRPAALLRLLTVPQEILWQRLLPHSGPRRDWEDDSSAKWHHTQSSQRGTNRRISTIKVLKVHFVTFCSISVCLMVLCSWTVGHLCWKCAVLFSAHRNSQEKSALL